MNALRYRDVTFVYVLYNPVNSLYKIGMSHNVEQRLAQIRQGAKQYGVTDIYLVGYFAFPSRKWAFDKERELHLLYAGDRVIGEWFSLGSQVYGLLTGLSNAVCSWHSAYERLSLHIPITLHESIKSDHKVAEKVTEDYKQGFIVWYGSLER